MLKINKMKIRNFKGIKKLDIDFSNRTLITGRNETGKTSIADAYYWLLFNKDSLNRSDFGVKPLDENDEEIHHLIISVESIIETDNNRYILRKEQTEDWTTHTGDAEPTLKGNSNKYYIDGEEVLLKDFKELVSSLADEKYFAILSNTNYFNDVLNWKKQRQTLINLFNVKTLSQYAQF